MTRTQGHGNPKWSRDETILALDLYFACGAKVPGSSDPRVVALSKQLRALPSSNRRAQRDSYRNPDGVSFKLQNLRQVATGKGLKNTSAEDKRVWEMFGKYPQRAAMLATLIRAGVALAQEAELPPVEDPEEMFEEGELLTRAHRYHERAKGVRPALLAARRQRGVLRCDLCSATANTALSAIEDAPFEVHHTAPLAMAIKRKTRLEDLALLCASCHRLLHRAVHDSGRWLTIGEARVYLGLVYRSR